FFLDRNRYDISMAVDYQGIMFDVLVAAQAEGWLVDLVAAAREARPANPAFVLAARDVGLTTGRADFEKILNASLPETDSSPWLARYGELEGRVCRIEVEPVAATRPVGTGFLIGPDLCMTNYHVMEQVVAGQTRPADIRLRFDYRMTADGRQLNAGTVFHLA